MTRSIETMMDFFLREKGELIHINGEQHTALLRDVADKIQESDEKIIRAATPIQTGDFIDYRNERYIIRSEIDKNEHSYRGRMRKCNYSIAFNWSGNVKWFDAIVEGKMFSAEKGQQISLQKGKIFVYLQDNENTRDISLNQKFINTHQPFKVEGIDHTNRGILKLSCELDSIGVNDDIDNQIADRWKYEIPHTYTLTINNGTNIQVLINDVLQLHCSATDNGNEMTNPAITFLSSDPTFVSVDNQGRVMGIHPGQATITAKLTYHPSVLVTIMVTAVENLIHNYSIFIEGTSTMTSGQTASFVTHIYDNGVEVFDQTVQWNLRNQDNSTPIMGSITASTGNSATVKAGSTTGDIVLSAYFENDSTITLVKTIQIKGLW